MHDTPLIPKLMYHPSNRKSNTSVKNADLRKSRTVYNHDIKMERYVHYSTFHDVTETFSLGSVDIQVTI